MKTILLLYLLWSAPLGAQDTFSILAFDSITRQVGAAGASCVDLFPFPQFSNDFICELFPDTGAIACQAAYVAANQQNSRQQMRAGDNPQQLLAYLKAYDVGSSPSAYQSRQYGVLRMGTGFAQTAAFTGTACMDYKNHIVGPNYTIHGNILLGQQVLDSMEAGFLRETGDLACKLMAAMRGARMVGADSRCAGNNSSSLFAFLKVSQPTDTFGKPSLLVSVRTHNKDSIEPIDSLQVLFNAVHSCSVNTSGIPQPDPESAELLAGQDVNRQVLTLTWDHLAGASVRITDSSGREIFAQHFAGRYLAISTQSWARGVYMISVITGTESKRMKVLIQ